MSFELIPEWYALHTKSRFENVVNEGLQKKSIDVFLPKIIVRSKRKDRRKMIRIPLFPGYIFVKTDLHPNHHLEIVKTIGAVRLVGDKAGPISIHDEVIESIKIMTAADQPIATGDYQFRKGDRVVVIEGPFAGVIGVFERFGTQGRVVVHIDALGQFAAVEVAVENVEKLPDIGGNNGQRP